MRMQQTKFCTIRMTKDFNVRDGEGTIRHDFKKDDLVLARRLSARTWEVVEGQARDAFIYADQAVELPTN